ncbi:hypothetical protein BV22DRAFT_1043187 [Leucogyrophana mollusca]|uniref:Uncharacterized protein n=1 Tax=Leucogyrophana mollusca TaxID=85980 RepID=A0ACB8BYQ8_9AGAM|nr:hypothetical protein BV22DRAFT_1043187 [Leucogyrophana mollusca]
MSSLNNTHVHFSSELALPPVSRLRQMDLRYPTVAQVKGSPDRRSSYDLFWRWDRLSSAALNESAESTRRESPSMLVFESSSECIILFDASEEQTNSIFGLTRYKRLPHDVVLRGTDMLRTKSVGLPPSWDTNVSRPSLGRSLSLTLYRTASRSKRTANSSSSPFGVCDKKDRGAIGPRQRFDGKASVKFLSHSGVESM